MKSKLSFYEGASLILGVMSFGLACAVYARDRKVTVTTSDPATAPVTPELQP